MTFLLSKKSSLCFLIFLLANPIGYAQIKNRSPIPSSSRQMIFVVTKSVEASKGFLLRFERADAKTEWKKTGDQIPVVLGRNGLGLGRGLHSSGSMDIPVKKEGDGKSPAGVFTLSSAFGYSPVEKMGNLKIPYIYVTDMLECVDDVNSKFYNSLVNRNKVEKVDWHSSEKMLMSGIWYELGVVVDHNKNPVQRGAGSCIFLHNWAGPEDSTSGCTAMAPSAMKKIVYWLDSSKKPILVQLTQRLYLEKKKFWGLPDMKNPFSSGSQHFLEKK